MRIIPNRTMRLGGRRVEFGKPVEVPDEDAQLAMRQGLAVAAAAKRSSPAAKPAAEPDEPAPAAE